MKIPVHQKRGIKICLLSLLFLCYPIAVFSQHRKAPSFDHTGYRIPLEYDPLSTVVPIVHLRVNGVSLAFILDTGCSFPLLLDSWASRQLHLSPNGEKANITNANITADIADLQSIELMAKPLGAKQEVPLAMPVKHGIIADLGFPTDSPYPYRIAGFAGISLFAPWTVQFDFVHQSLSLLPPSEEHLKKGKGVILPLKVQDNCYAVSAKRIDGTAVDLCVDTGHMWVAMPESLARNFQLMPTPDVFKNVWTVAGDQTGKITLMRSLRLGSLAEENLPVLFTNGDIPMHSLGMSFLSRFQVTIDQTHQEMLLEHNANFAQSTRLPGLQDVSVAKQQDEVTVYDVLPNSPAARAGIQRGDRIVTINAKQLKTLSRFVVQNMLNGYAGTKADLVVERAKETRSISYTRQSIFSMASGSVGLGIGIRFPGQGELIIGSVSPRSPAQRAGLQAGDKIISINNLPVASTPLARLAAEMKKPEGAEVVLEVVHKGDPKTYQYRVTVGRLY